MAVGTGAKFVPNFLGDLVDTLTKLQSEDFWQEFFQYKTVDGNFSVYDEADLKKFIDDKEYLPIVARLAQGESFPLPKMTVLNKKKSDKKRRVFVFDRGENYLLKAVAYLLNDYDRIFASNLYSFRRNVGVKNAVTDIVRKTKNRSLYSYKVDIHDYFNSVDTNIILPQLKAVLGDNEWLYGFIAELLQEPSALLGDEVVQCQKGIMAGIPISGFLANLYLKELDEWFAQKHAVYARYSDDIIVFAASSELIAEYENKIKEFLRDKNLTVNEKKERYTEPNQFWEFLGFRVEENTVDLSAVALQKMKDKMRRKARALVRWKNRTNAGDERAISAYIRSFNIKFFDNPKRHEVTWCRWYFPTITTVQSLRVLDEYMISCIRYIATGKHTKSNYNLRYQEIKKLGYRNLVNAYYRYKKTNLLLELN